ncbi:MULTISPECIES: hybrid sensor histidine kinase/response regulator [Hydrocarboniphaga]|jgi:two-component system sensor histidine kinase/response regulator|uniref:hybrid sensor histidine kinase/response regulator n=3 Tax=Nevskiaceae TaxID=568386 RepID=UPI00058C006B|nr:MULTISPECIES: hybrid sensor histidine kinase/response regulator [Hydrocarboniphaga]MDZ4079135.1 hybrid sensor histidine kinase/response regulator [Hydrocarboniphaga sp.]
MDRDVIFVVDDQTSNIEVVTALLERANYEVVPALSGEEVLEHCLRRTPSLVLLDMRMPVMDGFEVCEHLRANPRTADVPIIFLTAARERESVIQGFQHGAVDYVTKPFVAEELLARVKTHVELKRARDHLALVAQERADLTQIVAHDLKNPLSSILFAVDLLERGKDSPEKMAAEVRESAKHCLSFIDSYLGRWAKSQDLRKVEITPLRLAPVVRGTVDSFALLSQEREMKVSADIVEDPEVLGNATAIRHVLENLISNALRYAPRGSEVTVRCETGRSGMARVSVADRGPGVPRERQQQLFKRYVRLQADSEVQHASGLGLAISKEEITRMSGHLWYEDRENGGAVFSFVLPLAGKAAPRP